MRTSVAIAMLWAIPLAAAPVPKEVKKKADPERIQGAWLYDSWDTGNGAKGGQGRWWFEQNKMYSGVQQTGEERGTEYTFEIRPDKSPPELDYYSAGNLICSGIYKFENEQLHVAYTTNGIHPKDFSPQPGKAITILKRAPEAKK